MTDERYQLVIGTKMWSSWSLRPWLLMRVFGLAFDEIAIALRASTTAAAISRSSPSGKIPALVEGDLTVWDSLAIIEYLADTHPQLPIWPGDRKARAIARAVSAEMHSGFVALRQNCPMDFCARGLTPPDPTAITADVARVVAIWRHCRTTYGGTGPFLFSQFSAADAMFAPVVSRFVTYGCDLSGIDEDATAARYLATMMALPAMAEWAQGAQTEAAALPG